MSLHAVHVGSPEDPRGHRDVASLLSVLSEASRVVGCHSMQLGSGVRAEQSPAQVLAGSSCVTLRVWKTGQTTE